MGARTKVRGVGGGEKAPERWWSREELEARGVTREEGEEETRRDEVEENRAG